MDNKKQLSIERKKKYMAEYMPKYYQKNRERFRQWFSQKTYCKVCNKDIIKHNFSRHEKSKIHQARISHNKEDTKEKVNIVHQPTAKDIHKTLQNIDDIKKVIQNIDYIKKMIQT